MLKAFGLFTQTPLDFAGDKILHVVYGPNGAGKSTTLRAVGDLLFGIPERTADAFLHQAPDLRLGAVLLGRDGSPIEVVRRKGRKDTLLSPDGAALDEAVLARLLGGIDRKLFESAFGLSRDRLVAGGKELLAGRGGMGEVLFGAALGAAGLHELLRALDAETEALFKPQGHNPRVNAALRELSDARKRIQQLALQPAEYSRRNQELADAQDELVKLERELMEAREGMVRLARLQRVLPLVAERDQALAERDALGHEREVPEALAEARAHASADLDGAVAARVEAEGRIVDLESRRSEHEVSAALVARAEEVTALHREIGAYAQAGRDLPRVEAELREAERDARVLATALFPDTGLSDLDSRRPHPAALGRVSELARDHGELRGRVGAAEDSLREKEAVLTRAEAALQALPPAADAGRLEAAVQAAQRAGALESELEENQAAVVDIEGRAGAGLAGLGLWTGSLQELEALPVPVAETVERFERELADIDRRRGPVVARADTERTRAAEAARRLAELEAAGELPGEDELAAARTRRDRGWALVRAAWLEGAADEEAARAFDAERPLDRAYEGSVAESDRVADVRLQEAERLAERAQLDSTRHLAEKDLADAEAQLEELVEEEARVREAWQKSWRPAGIDPLPPAEMRAWLGRRNALTALAGQRRDMESAAHRQERTAKTHLEALAEALGTLKLAAGEPAETLAARLDRAGAELRGVEKANGAREKAEERVDTLGEERDVLAERLNGARAAFAAWQDNWTEAIQVLALPGSASPEQAQAVAADLAKLFALLDEAAGFRRRVEGMKRIRDTFETAALGLTGELAPDLADLSAEQAVGLLNVRLTVALTAAAATAQLDEQLALERAARDKADRLAADAEFRLAALVAQVDCRDLNELLEAERLSAAAREFDKRVAGLESQIVVAGARPLSELLVEAEGTSADEVDAGLPGKEAEVADLESRLAPLLETIGAQRQDVARMDGSDEAAMAAEEAASLLARIRREGEEYARHRLASALLRRAIDRYREESQGPLVRRVGELFPLLTAGSFDGVAVDYDDRDEPVLAGRRGGVHVRVEGMSDGERDQLYLALRIASIERYAEAGDPPPLIADDLFLNFDDERARAGLEVLAELAGRMQVLFFTHHLHLVDIARDAISGGVLRVHELAGPAWPPNAQESP